MLAHLRSPYPAAQLGRADAALGGRVVSFVSAESPDRRLKHANRDVRIFLQNGPEVPSNELQTARRCTRDHARRPGDIFH